MTFNSKYPAFCFQDIIIITFDILFWYSSKIQKESLCKGMLHVIGFILFNHFIYIFLILSCTIIHVIDYICLIFWSENVLNWLDTQDCPLANYLQSSMPTSKVTDMLLYSREYCWCLHLIFSSIISNSKLIKVYRPYTRGQLQISIKSVIWGCIYRGIIWSLIYSIRL